MNKSTVFVSVLVAALSSASAIAAEPAMEIGAMSNMSDNVVAMSEGQLSAVEGAGGGDQSCTSSAAAGGGLVSVPLLSGLNILNCSPIAINLSVLSAGAGSATAIVNAQ